MRKSFKTRSEFLIYVHFRSTFYIFYFFIFGCIKLVIFYFCGSQEKIKKCEIRFKVDFTKNSNQFLESFSQH